jgi:hypothetical protein
MQIGNKKVDIFFGTKQSGSERKRPNATGTAGDKSSHSLEGPSRAFTTALHQYLQLSLSLSPSLFNWVRLYSRNGTVSLHFNREAVSWLGSFEKRSKAYNLPRNKQFVNRKKTKLTKTE